MQDLRSAAARPDHPVRRREHVPRRGPGVRGDRGAAARLGDGRGGAVPARPDSQVLRARPHGHRGAGAVRRRRRRRSSWSVLAVEELARVDASAAIYVDVQNTLVNNAFLRWGNDEQQRALFPAAHRAICSARTRCPSRAAAAMPSRSRRAPSATGDGWVLTGRKIWITNGAEAGVFIVFANADPSKGYKGITGVHRRARASRASPSARRRTSSASAPRAPPSSSSSSARCPRRTCSARSARATRSRSRR